MGSPEQLTCLAVQEFHISATRCHLHSPRVRERTLEKSAKMILFSLGKKDQPLLTILSKTGNNISVRLGLFVRRAEGCPPTAGIINFILLFEFKVLGVQDNRSQLCTGEIMLNDFIASYVG